MKKFKTGHIYFINGGGEIYVIKRTPCYIKAFGKTKHGEFKTSRFFIYDLNLFGLGENILITNENCKSVKYFCFAGHEKEEG